MPASRDAETQAPPPDNHGIPAGDNSESPEESRCAPFLPLRAVKRSAGLLMFRHMPAGGIEVLLAHPGGPFWRNRDAGAWTIPKGEYVEAETALAAARREFTEETGFAISEPLLPLGEVVQKSGKRITAWAFEGDCDPAQLRCNSFEMEWPPHSGQRQNFPEIDRVGWFTLEQARDKMLPAQCELLDRLELQLRGG